MKSILNENIVIDTFLIYQFLKRLVVPFEKTEAFKLGLIDGEGKILKHRKDLTSEEKKHFTIFDLMIWNLKKLLGKLPFGKTTIASYAAALFLLREQKNPDILLNQDYLYEHFLDFYESILKSPNDLAKVEQLMEDAPVNVVGAGMGYVGSESDHNQSMAGIDKPLNKKKSKILRRKKNELSTNTQNNIS